MPRRAASRRRTRRSSRRSRGRDRYRSAKRPHADASTLFADLPPDVVALILTSSSDHPVVACKQAIDRFEALAKIVPSIDEMFKEEDSDLWQHLATTYGYGAKIGTWKALVMLRCLTAVGRSSPSRTTSTAMPGAPQRGGRPASSGAGGSARRLF